MDTKWTYSDFWAAIKVAPMETREIMAIRIDAVLVEMLPKLTRRWRTDVLSNAPEAVIESLFKRDIITREDVEALGDKGIRIALLVDY